MDPIPGDKPGKRVSTLSLELRKQRSISPHEEANRDVVRPGAGHQLVDGVAECKPADDKKMDKKEAKAKKHKKAKKEKAEDKKDKM